MRNLLSSTVLLLLVLVGLSLTSAPAQAQYYNPQLCLECDFSYNTSLMFCWLGYAFGGYDSVGFLDCTTNATWAYNDCVSTWCNAALLLPEKKSQDVYAILDKRSVLQLTTGSLS